MRENGANKRQRLRAIIIWVTVLFLLVLNVGASVNLNAKEGGSCISITFDKLPMLLVNKAVLYVDGEQYDISDNKLVREIAYESIVATNTDICIHGAEKRWIELYVGDVLIRRIGWTEHDDFLIYEASLIYWIPFSIDGDGLVSPPDELINRLESIIDKN